MALPAKAERHEASIRTGAESGAGETILYVARPGLAALPEGMGVAFALAVPQAMLCGFFLWAIWFPWPRDTRTLLFDITLSLLLCALGAGIFWKITRGQGQIARAILRASFVRLTVSDRRVLWTVPWSATPLMELEASRILGGILGDADRHGRGTAAIILTPGDPAGDYEGRIHLDRLPDAAGFVAALARLA